MDLIDLDTISELYKMTKWLTIHNNILLFVKRDSELATVAFFHFKKDVVFKGLDTEGCQSPYIIQRRYIGVRALTPLLATTYPTAGQFKLSQPV